MAIKPWYNILQPREDLREGKPLDASEFAVHLDQVRDGRAPRDYQNPEAFFERTYLTRNLTSLAAEVVRRLSGIKVETSPVFNMSTQFGGGKTHALTLLYHLAKNGTEAKGWMGVNKILEKAGVPEVPEAAVATFVGTEFDSLTGRGGEDGTPLRKTPWGEIAWQLGGEESFAVVSEHDREFTEPKGDVIRAMLPKGKPCIILMDEIINYVSTYRDRGFNDKLYNFIHSLSETAKGENKLVLVVSIPASELEYTAADAQDEDRFKKMLDRNGKAIMMSADNETSEIIRRRLFEWDPRMVTSDGKVSLHKEALETCREFGDLALENRSLVPGWFSVDDAKQAFESSYPFHPSVMSVFERKWQVLNRFQRTRGVLRLLAQWVSIAYQESYRKVHKDALITLGTAPLDDLTFRSAVFEQLGEDRLEAAVTTDIKGKNDCHACRLDTEAVDTIKKARLHQKVSTVIFFESNGGQARGEASLSEIRLAVMEPGLDVGNVDTVLESLISSCYYLSAHNNRFKFSISPNLNKIFAGRTVNLQKVEERVKNEIQKVFSDFIPFPDQSNRIPDRAALTFSVLSPECSKQNPQTTNFINGLIQEYGRTARTFKSALIFAVADNDAILKEEARRCIAWEEIFNEQEEIGLDETQKRQLLENRKRARRDLAESVWRTYRHIAYLKVDNTVDFKDMGHINSSSGKIVDVIKNCLRQEGILEDGISPNFLVRNWPPAFDKGEWSTKSARDAFFASPKFPRMINPEAIKSTIAKGVNEGRFAYVGKTSTGYDPVHFQDKGFRESDVEITDDMFIIKPDVLEEFRKIITQDVKDDPQTPSGQEEIVSGETGDTAVIPVPDISIIKPPIPPEITMEKTESIKWSGEIPYQKWNHFYIKVLAKHANLKSLKIKVNFEVFSQEGIPKNMVEETKIALRELGLTDEMIEG